MVPRRCLSLLACLLSAFVCPGSLDAAAPPAQAEHTDRYGDALPSHALARLGTTRLWHWGNVHCLAFAPNGKILASGGRDEQVRLWDLATAKQLHLLTGHTSSVLAVAFSPDGKLLASAQGDSDCRIFLWDTRSWNKLSDLSRTDHRIDRLSFSSDSKTLFSVALDAEVIAWDSRTGRQRRLRGLMKEGRVMALSPLTGTLASGSSDGTILFRKIDGSQEAGPWRAHRDGVSAVALSPDGKTVASGGVRHDVRLWQVNGKAIRRLGQDEGPVQAIAFSPDGKMLAAAGEHTIRLLDVASGRLAVSSPSQVGSVSAIAFSADGKRLAVTGSRITLRETATLKELPVLDGHRAGLSCLAVSPDGKVLASRGLDRTIRLWNLHTGREFHRFALEEPRHGSVAFSPDGKRLLWQDEATIRVAEPATGKQLAAFKGERLAVHFVLAPDGKHIAVATDTHSVMLVDPASGKIVRRIIQHRHPVQALAFYPDGQILATTSHDARSLRLWTVASGDDLDLVDSRMFSPSLLAFSPDGKTLALGVENTVFLWDLLGRKCIADLDGHKGAVAAIAFSADGRFLASAERTGPEIRVWEVNSGKQRCLFKGHESSVDALVFTPDSKKLISGSGDTTCLIWDVLGNAAQGKQVVPARQWEDAWADLASADAGKAHAAIGLLARGTQTVEWIARRLKPAAPTDRRRLERLLEELDADDFAVRRKASEALAAMCPVIEPALRRVLRGNPSLEVRHRIGMLLKQRWAFSPDQLRVLRAIEVLERIADAPARKTLLQLAGGEPEVLLTEEAIDASRRLNRQRAAKR